MCRKFTPFYFLHGEAEAPGAYWTSPDGYRMLLFENETSKLTTPSTIASFTPSLLAFSHAPLGPLDHTTCRASLCFRTSMVTGSSWTCSILSRCDRSSHSALADELGHRLYLFCVSQICAMGVCWWSRHGTFTHINHRRTIRS